MEVFAPLMSGTPRIVNALFASLVISTIPKLVDRDIMTDQNEDAAKVGSSFRKLRNKKLQTFDYIVVGAGSAGSIVANRLSVENKVLLLEAGGTPSPISEIPLFKPNLKKTKMVYHYKTVPQKFMGLAFKNRVQPILRGKALGGSGQVNSMMYVRGHRLDFDKLVHLLGDSSFSFENTLKAYKKQEDYHGSYPNPKFHSTGGELYVGKEPYVTKISKYIFKALREKNITIGDYNSEIQDSEFGFPDVLIKNGRRWGGYEAFLEPILNRTNLSIYKYAFVNKILMDSTAKAIGVDYTRHGLKFKAYASKEVIICAGVFESPKLLLLSGIGDPEQLKAFQINSTVNLPGVGKNLIDSPGVPIYVVVNNRLSFVNKRDLTPRVVQMYLKNKTGPLASDDFRPAVGYSNTANNKPTSWPNIWNKFQAAAFAEFTRGTSTYDGPKLRQYLKKYKNKDGLVISVEQVKITSTPGEVRLMSDKPEDHPVIDPNYLNNANDLEAFVDGVNVMVNLIEKTEALAKAGAHLIPDKFPGCENFNFKSREYWKCYIRETGFSTFHAIGTCKMGKTTDSHAVVDPEFRVLKAKNLRVIDSSVIPFYLSGNPHAETMMFAEIGSAKVLGKKI